MDTSKIKYLRAFINKIYASFPHIDLTIKLLAAELKVLCERISWYIVLTEDMMFAVSQSGTI